MMIRLPRSAGPFLQRAHVVTAQWPRPAQCRTRPQGNRLPAAVNACGRYLVVTEPASYESR